MCMLNHITFNKVKNLTTIYADGIMYGIDWNTGLAWQRATGQGCPYYCESFKENFNKIKQIGIDKPFSYKV